MKLRAVIFWIHLALGIATGLVGALMAGTGAVMAFADSYLDARESSLRHLDPLKGGNPKSLEELVAQFNADHPESPVNRIGFDDDPSHAYYFYYDKQGLAYMDPYSGESRPTDSVPLRRTLHKGVEQWHRFFGFSGERRQNAKIVTSWFNVALIPLLLTGLIVWLPRKRHRRHLRAALSPAGNGRGRGSERSWHTALGFWAMPFLLIMVATATTHSFEWIRNMGYRISGNPSVKLERADTLWAPGVAPQPVPSNVERLTLDDLFAIANRELPGWTSLDIFPAPPINSDNRVESARLVAKAPGWGPSFFPIVMHLHPYTGETLSIHSWRDLSAGTRFIAWSRWLHKGEAFGRLGQIVAGLSCLIMLALIYTGWAMAIRRLFRSMKSRRSVSLA